MPIRVTCPSCHLTFRVGDHQAGRRGLCPECGEVVAVPDHELPRLDPIDEPADRRHRYADPDGPRRSPSAPPPVPRAHVSAWRSVGTGYLIQQGGAAVNFLAVLLVVTAGTVLNDPHADPNADPDVAQVVCGLSGLAAWLLGTGLLAVGRFVSARTPVRAPRPPGWISALITAAQLPAGCLVGGLAAVVGLDQQQQGNPNPAAVLLVGFGVVGWIGLLAAGEACHGFAVGSAGRVLRADGVKLFGRGLAALVIGGGFLVLLSLCVIGAVMDDQNPNGQNPAANQAEDELMIGWLVGASVLVGLYLVLDVVLLQMARAAIHRIAAPADDYRPDDDWE